MERYRRRLSGPLRDRFDLALDLPAVSWKELHEAVGSETSAVVRDRVVAARRRQLTRQGRLNARLDGRVLERVCRITDEESESILARGSARFSLSARAICRILRVARTIADLAGQETLSADHLAEALQFRLQDEASPV